MSSFSVRLKDWAQDRVLRRIARNSSYLIASSMVNALMSIVTANLLGARDLGALTLVMGFVSLVNQLLSFRMGDLVVRYFGAYLKQGDLKRSAALVKAAALAESLTSLLAYAILGLVSPIYLSSLAENPGLDARKMIMIYGLTILANLATETSNGVLQVTGHYRDQAMVNFAQAILSAFLIGWASVTGGSIWIVLMIYLLGRIIMGTGPMILALHYLPQNLGKNWWRTDFSSLPPFKELAHFGLTTNFSGTINLIARDSEALWLGLFFNTSIVGYYKVALAVINLVILPINPFISTSYPEITRAVVGREWLRLRSLLRRVTAIAAAWTALVAIGLAFFGIPVLFSTWNVFGYTFDIYGPEWLPAFPIMMVLLLGYGTANIFFWNRSLLLALDMPGYPLKVAFVCMLFKVVLAFVLVPHFGPVEEAALLTSYFIASVSLILWRGLSQLHRKQVEPTLQPLEV